MTMVKSVRLPTQQEIEVARQLFEKNEPRDLFYRAATELTDLALRGQTALTTAEAIAVLLQTWNKNFYRFHRRFDPDHFADIERLLVNFRDELAQLRKRSITRLGEADRERIQRLFGSFEEVLGPVGAAKALHLLCPEFFPLWDQTIAKAYGLTLKEIGRNSPRYWKFMGIVQQQCAAIVPFLPGSANALKALDEFNYCRFTKRWL